MSAPFFFNVDAQRVPSCTALRADRRSEVVQLRGIVDQDALAHLVVIRPPVQHGKQIGVVGLYGFGCVMRLSIA